MVGERRKGASNDALRGVARAGARGRHEERRAEKKVMPLPKRRPRRAGSVQPSSEKRAVGRGRLRIIVGAVALVCGSLGVRAAQVSFASDDHYQAFAAEQQGTTAKDGAARGAIVSADGRNLAMSLRASKVVATPYQIEDPKAAAGALAGVLGKEAEDASDIEKKLRPENGGYSVVAEGVEPEEASKVSELGIAGISVEPDAVRTYPDNQLASQLVGYLGADRAHGGVEARYDDTLKSGEDVKLTIDVALQQELEEELADAAKKYDGKSALGVVLRVEDGAVMALANVPGYDNNRFGKATSEAQRNRVLTDPYEPGSTFKPFTMAAALEEDAIAEGDTFVVPDHMQVADRMVHDSEQHETKIMTPKNILEQSSNIGTIQVAQRLGGERLEEHIKDFGFGEGTGVDLGSEDPGRVPPLEEWSGSSIGNIPIGQGLTATPLQLAAGYATLANGGYRVTPYVSQSDAPKGPGQRVISEKTSSIVREMLQSVVDEGTGHLARIPGYTAAGKTGTAQKVDPKTGLYGTEYVTSFIGFAPAKDPKYVALIVVDEPQVEIWGEVVAAPAFSKLMSFALEYSNVPPDRKEKESPAPTATAGGAR